MKKMSIVLELEQATRYNMNMNSNKALRILFVIIGVFMIFSIIQMITGMFFSSVGLKIIGTIVFMYLAYLVYRNGFSVSFDMKGQYKTWKKQRYFKQMDELGKYIRETYGEIPSCPQCGESLTVFTVTLQKTCKNCGKKL